MKLCILSMQKVNNFGSLLQSYALKKILNSIGHEVHFIDIESREQDNALRMGRAVVFKEDIDKYSRFGLIRIIKKIDRYFFRRVWQRIQYKRQNDGFERFREKYLDIAREDNTQHYEYCVIGSDEVFNCIQDTAWGFTAQLYGDVKQADKVVTYAASCGSATLENVPSKVKEKIRQTFTTVIAFSVRDANTYRFVYELSGQRQNISTNLDPALITNFNKEIIEASHGFILPEKFCLIYAYIDRIHDAREIDAIKEFCKSRGLAIIAMGMPQYWIKNYIIANPFQLLYAFTKADFVITDTFHGTIFSFKYTKRFCILKRASNNNKLGDLIERLGIAEHVIEDMRLLNHVYDNVKDQNYADSIIDNGNADAIAYLKGCII